MKLEAGMWVRTTYGRIYKIEKVETKKVYYSCNPLELQWQDREFVYSKSGMECETAISKASHSLLGNDEEPCLIEVGDYVNGERVINIMKKHKYLEVSDEEIIIDEKDIKTIVTKEQFEQMQYKVVD